MNDQVNHVSSSVGGEVSSKNYTSIGVTKFFVFTMIGILAFFANVTIGDQRTIIITHLVNFIQRMIAPITPYLLILLCVLAVVDVFRNPARNLTTTTGKVFSVVRVLGLVCLIMAIFNVGPALLHDERVLPFTLNRVVTPMMVVIPVSALFLPCLLSTGFVETIGLILRPIMRPLLKVPGRSAVISITAFFSANAVGIIAIDRMYKEGKFTAREAALLATSFCTQAVGFLIIVAGMTGLMPHWNLFFFGTFLILVVCAIVTGRIWPLSKKPDTCYDKCDYQDEEVVKQGLIKRAFEEGFGVAENMGSMATKIAMTMKATLNVLTVVIATSMFFATAGLALVYHTPIFHWIGYIFYPVAALLQLPDTHLVGASGSSVLVAALNPAILANQTDSFVTTFVLACMPITTIISFGLTVPVYLTTSIPLKLWEILVIWIERVIISMITATLIAMAYSALFL